MDVFSKFLVTLDYPMRQLHLGPLPPRPDDLAAAKPTLQTSTSSGEDDDDSEDSSSAKSSDTTQKPAAPRGPRDRYVAPEMNTWTPIYRVGHDLMVPTTLNGAGPKLFILDTGAFTTTITPAVAREVTKVHSDDNLVVRGISGKVDKVYSADKITFRFAHLSQEVNDVVAFDTPKISRNVGMEISGFIGFTALGQTTMQIDYRDGLVNFNYEANRGYNH